MNEIAYSSLDLLTEKEIEALRLLHSNEAFDYAKGFYFNEFFDSIKVMKQCEQCDKEFLDLAELRDHILQYHQLGNPSAPLNEAPWQYRPPGLMNYYGH